MLGILKHQLVSAVLLSTLMVWPSVLIAEPEPPAINSASRKISDDEMAEPTRAPAAATPAATKSVKPKVRKDQGVASEKKLRKDPGVAATNSKLNKDPGVAAKANFKKDPGVGKKAGAKSDETLAVQTSAPAGGVTAGGTTSPTTAATLTGTNSSITGVTSMKALASSDSVSAPLTTSIPTSTDSAQSMQMLAMALSMFKGFGSQSPEDQQAELIAIAEKANAITSTRLGASPEVYLNPGCRKCMEAASNDPRFQRCDSRNGYLEDQFETGKMAPEKAEPKRSNVTCIAESIRGSSMSNVKYCPQPGGNGSSPGARACASESMVKRVAQAFEDVSSCLGDFVVPAAQNNPAIQDDFQRSMFQIVNHESAFTMNVVSGTGAAGLGQLTKDAIKEINTSQLAGAMNHMRNSSKPSCQRLAKVPYEKMSGADDCSAMSLTNGNPELNLIYTALHMKMVRNQAEGTVDGMGVNFSSPEARENFLNDMSIWGHNVGSGGLNSALTTVLASSSSMLSSGNKAGFYGILSKRILNTTPSPPENPNRPNEAAGFFFKTEGDLKRVEDKSNGKCGV